MDPRNCESWKNPWKDVTAKAPENMPGPKEGSLPTIIFQGLSLLNFEGVSLLMDFSTLDLFLSNSYSGDSRGFPDAMPAEASLENVGILNTPNTPASKEFLPRWEILDHSHL